MKFTILGRLDGLNAYTTKNRTNPYAGAKMKHQNEKVVIYYIRKAKLKKVEKFPIKLKIKWYEPNKRRDVDNICFAVKFIQDALVKEGIIPDDSQQYITSIEHEVLVDKDNERIEVELVEC